MAKSVTADAPFKQTSLEFKSEGSFQTGEDEYGNPVFSSNDPVVLKAVVAPNKAEMLRRQPGADPKVFPIKGELVDPKESDLMRIGSTCRLEFQGMPATLSVTAVFRNDVIGVDFGDGFLGDVRLD